MHKLRIIKIFVKSDLILSTFKKIVSLCIFLDDKT